MTDLLPELTRLIHSMDAFLTATEKQVEDIKKKLDTPPKLS